MIKRVWCSCRWPRFGSQLHGSSQPFVTPEDLAPSSVLQEQQESTQCTYMHPVNHSHTSIKIKKRMKIIKLEMRLFEKSRGAGVMGTANMYSSSTWIIHKKIPWYLFFYIQRLYANKRREGRKGGRRCEWQPLGARNPKVNTTDSWLTWAEGQWEQKLVCLSHEEMSREESIGKLSSESLLWKPRIKPCSNLRLSGRLQGTRQAGLSRKDYKRVPLEHLTEPGEHRP